MSAAPEMRVRWRLAAGYVLAILSVAFLVRFAGVNRSDFVGALSELHPTQWLLAFILFTLCAVINAVAFSFLLNADRAATSAAWLAALPAKYVPIGVGHVVGRGVLLMRHGVRARDVVVTGLQEQLLSLMLCVFAGAAAWLVTRPFASVATVLLLTCLALVASIAALAVSMPRVAGRWRRATAAVLLYATALLPFAGGYLLLARPDEVAAFVAILFGGTVAGTIAVLSPGGLGVREAVVGVLSGDASVAVAGLAAARAVILISELALCAFGQIVIRAPLGGRLP